MADEHEHGVLGRLLERLQQGVRGVAAHRLGLADQVRPARRLERPQVQVAAQLADLVDQDRLALRLDDVQVGVLLGLDAVLVGGEQRRDERVRRVVLPRAARAVQQVRVPRVSAASRSRRAASGWPYELTHRAPPRPGRPTVATSPSASTSVTRPGSRRGDVRERVGHGGAEAVALALDPVGLLGLARCVDEDDRAVRQQAVGGEQADARTCRGRARGRRPGTRRTSRCSGRRSPRRREPAPGDHVGDQLRAAGREQQRLGARADVPVAVVEHERPDALAERRPAGLAALDHVVARPRAGAPPGGGPASTCRRRRDPRGTRTSPRNYLRVPSGASQGAARCRRDPLARFRGSRTAPRPGMWKA